jgi:hypothetical protein
MPGSNMAADLLVTKAASFSDSAELPSAILYNTEKIPGCRARIAIFGSADRHPATVPAIPLDCFEHTDLSAGLRGVITPGSAAPVLVIVE